VINFQKPCTLSQNRLPNDRMSELATVRSNLVLMRVLKYTSHTVMLPELVLSL